MLKEGEIMALPGAQTPECAAIARNHGRPPPGCSFGVPCKHEREISAIMLLLFETKRRHLIEKTSGKGTAFVLNDRCRSDHILGSSDESHLLILGMLA